MSRQIPLNSALDGRLLKVLTAMARHVLEGLSDQPLSKTHAPDPPRARAKPKEQGDDAAE
jgi:hypothetical protein